MSGLRPFDALVTVLQGRVPDGMPWPEVIALANHTLLTPRVYAALSAKNTLDRVPSDVRNYLAFLHSQNVARNERLGAQLVEAVVALNAAGLVPILLKGARPLFLSGDGPPPDRMTSDLDVAIPQDGLARAERVLADLGYTPAGETRGMWRPDDVGLFELRPWHPGPRGDADLDRVRRDGMDVLMPTEAALALHWIRHDLLKEGDLVRGRLDLRHLVDIVDLGASGLDWDLVESQTTSDRERLAFHTQLQTAHDLFGMPIPDSALRNRMAELHARRRSFMARHAKLGIPLRLTGNAAWAFRKTGRILPLLRRGPRTVLSRGLGLLFDLRPRSKL